MLELNKKVELLHFKKILRAVKTTFVKRPCMILAPFGGHSNIFKQLTAISAVLKNPHPGDQITKIKKN